MRRAWKAALGNALPSPDEYVKVIVVADSGLEIEYVRASKHGGAVDDSSEGHAVLPTVLDRITRRLWLGVLGTLALWHSRNAIT